MKIVHVVRQYYPSLGGMEDVVRNIARFQREEFGQSPRIVTLDRLFRGDGEALPAQSLVDGTPVLRLPYRGSERYPLCPAVLNEVRDADLVHVHGVDFFFDYLALTRPLHRRPLIASTHGGFFHTRFARRLKQLYFHTVTRGTARQYARIVATSENDGALFGRVAQRNLEVIENGVDIDKFADRAAPAPTRTLLYFGRWSVNKGILAALDFVAALRRQEPGWTLTVAGREYDYDLARLRAEAAQRGLGDAVELVANPSDAELAQLMGRASYFIGLSEHEGFGMAPVEAMSAGLTPVLADIPPFRRLLGHAGAGILVADGGQAAAVRALLADHAAGGPAKVRAQLRQAAQAYGWRSAAGRYAAAYARALGRAAA